MFRKDWMKKVDDVGEYREKEERKNELKGRKKKKKERSKEEMQLCQGE